MSDLGHLHRQDRDKEGPAGRTLHQVPLRWILLWDAHIHLIARSIPWPQLLSEAKSFYSPMLQFDEHCPLQLGG